MSLTANMIERIAEWCAHSDALGDIRSRARGEYFGYDEPGEVKYLPGVENLSSRERRFLGWFVFSFRLADGKHPSELTAAALLRNRIFCPRCGKPLVLRRRSVGDKFYYFCSRLFHASPVEHCTYRRFVPGTWDDTVWDCAYAILKDDSWIQQRLSATEKQNHDIDRLIKLEQQKTHQFQNKMARVREGFEGGLYDLNEAKSKVDGYQEAIGKAEKEIGRLTWISGHQNSKVNIEELKRELERLAQSNLDNATFTDKQDILSKLGITVYPSEDLKTMKMKCSLDFRNGGSSQPSDGCGIIQFGSLRSQ